MRSAARRDRTEAAIVDALEQIGVVCYRQSAKGLPDLLTWNRGAWLPVEVKTPHGTLTPAQAATRAATPYPIVRSVTEALALFGVTDV